MWFLCPEDNVNLFPSALLLVCLLNGCVSLQIPQKDSELVCSSLSWLALCFLWNLLLHFHDLQVRQYCDLQVSVVCVLDLHLVHSFRPAGVDTNPNLSLSLHALACPCRNSSNSGHNGVPLLGNLSQSSLAPSGMMGNHSSLIISSDVTRCPIWLKSKLVLYDCIFLSIICRNLGSFLSRDFMSLIAPLANWL